MKAQGLKEKSDFELTATNMGLYFDKHPLILWFRWFFHGRALWALLGAAAALLLTLFTYSTVTQMRGHFTINMTDSMFREGFVLSETVGFENPVTYLFCTPAENVPCVSISHLPEDLDTVDGQHNADYFAYTFYCRNAGQSTVDYEWFMSLNSESQNLSNAVWVMIFEDGKMTFYARANSQTGEAEALPAFGDDSRGYIGRPLGDFAKDPEQYELLAEKEHYSYYRAIPKPFLTDLVVGQGVQNAVAPGDTHKYTVVIWLEGDDPDCTNEKIGGHVGMDFRIQLLGEQNQEESDWWENLWDGLTFWDNPTPTDPE
jgi:hypothetical protein